MFAIPYLVLIDKLLFVYSYVFDCFLTFTYITFDFNKSISVPNVVNVSICQEKVNIYCYCKFLRGFLHKLATSGDGNNIWIL